MKMKNEKIKIDTKTHEVKPPSDEEIQAKLIEPHRHHLVGLETGQKTVIKEGVATVVTSKDWYCFTCEKWIGLYGVKFDTIPKSSRNAMWIDGAPPEVQKEREELKELRPILLFMDAEKSFRPLIRKLRKSGLSDDEITDAFETVLEEGG